MTQAALQFDAHTLLLGLLGMVCGFLAYWGTRLEQRVDELKARQCLLAEEMHKSYVPREDCRERTAQILGGLERADEKLDRIADAIRTGGRCHARKAPELPRASGRLCRDTGGASGTCPAGLQLFPAGVFSALLPRRG